MIRTTKVPATRAAWPDRSSHGIGSLVASPLLAAITVASVIRSALTRQTTNAILVGQQRLMISGACSASVARCAGSGGPDLLQLKLETLEWGAGFQQLEIVEPLGLTFG